MVFLTARPEASLCRRISPPPSASGAGFPPRAASTAELPTASARRISFATDNTSAGTPRPSGRRRRPQARHQPASRSAQSAVPKFRHLHGYSLVSQPGRLREIPSLDGPDFGLQVRRAWRAGTPTRNSTPGMNVGGRNESLKRLGVQCCKGGPVRACTVYCCQPGDTYQFHLSVPVFSSSYCAGCGLLLN